MFKYAVVFALIAVATAASSDDVHAEVIALKSDVRPDGFETILQTSNDIDQKQYGDEHGNIHGEFSWVDPNGEHVKVSYVADENGYQPNSEWLPTPPPIPAYILKAIEYNAAHAPRDDKHH